MQGKACRCVSSCLYGTERCVSSRLMSVGVESISVLPERPLSRGPLAQCPLAQPGPHPAGHGGQVIFLL